MYQCLHGRLTLLLFFQPLHFVATCTNTLWLAKSIFENPYSSRDRLTESLEMLQHLVQGPSRQRLMLMNKVRHYFSNINQYLCECVAFGFCAPKVECWSCISICRGVPNGYFLAFLCPLSWAKISAAYYFRVHCSTWL